MKKNKRNGVKRKKFIDHEGRKFRTQKEMVEYWGSNARRYVERIGMGWSVEEALVVPAGKKKKEYMEKYLKEEKRDSGSGKREDVVDEVVCGEEEVKHEAIDTDWLLKKMAREAESKPMDEYSKKYEVLRKKGRDKHDINELIDYRDLRVNMGFAERPASEISDGMALVVDTGDDNIRDTVLTRKLIEYDMEDNVYRESPNVIKMDKEIDEMIGDVRVRGMDEIYNDVEKQIHIEFPNLKKDDREGFFRLLDERGTKELNEESERGYRRLEEIATPEQLEMIVGGRLSEDSRRRIENLQRNKEKELEIAELKKGMYDDVPVYDWRDEEVNNTPYNRIDNVRREALVDEIKYPLIEKDLNKENLDMVDQEIYGNRMVLRNGAVGTRVIVPESWLLKIGMEQVMSIRNGTDGLPSLGIYVLGVLVKQSCNTKTDLN